MPLSLAFGLAMILMIVAVFLAAAYILAASEDVYAELIRDDHR